jgi:hypothetical protein
MTEVQVNGQAVEDTTGEIVQEATAGDVAVQETTAVVATTRAGSNYVVQMMQAIQQDFIDANEGMDLDYVRAGDWLKLNKKGNYVESADDSVSYGDSVEVVVAQGEQRYMLWGADNSPESGQIVTAERTREEAEQALGAFLSENPEAAERYCNDDIQLRYLAYLVPVQTLQADEMPQVYIMDLPKGDTIGWGKYAQSIFKGKYRALGIPPRTPVNRVVTRFTSEERKSSNGNESYLGTKFEPIGLFNPADYGIDETAATE